MAGNDTSFSRDPAILANIDIDIPPGEHESMRDEYFACTMIEFMPSVDNITNRKLLKLLCKSFSAHLESVQERFMLNDSFASMKAARDGLENFAARIYATLDKTSSRAISSIVLTSTRQLFGEAIKVLVKAIDEREINLHNVRSNLEPQFNAWTDLMRNMIEEFNALLENSQIRDEDLQQIVFNRILQNVTETMNLYHGLNVLRYQILEHSKCLDGKILTARKLLSAARNAEIAYHRQSTRKRHSATLTIFNDLQVTHLKSLLEPEVFIIRGIDEIKNLVRFVFPFYMV